MFCHHRRRQKKKCQDDVEVGDTAFSGPQKSVNVQEDPKQDPVVHDTPATSDPTEAPKEKAKKKASWWRRLFRREEEKNKPVKEEDVAENTKLFTSSDTQKSVDTTGEPKGGQTVQEASPSPDTTVSPYVISDNLPTDNLERQPTPTGHGVNPLAKPLWTKIYAHLTKPFTSASPENKLICLGFPNLSQTCYMNSTLQGLLTLKHFVQEVRRQQQVWRFHPKSKLLRRFVEVSRIHNNEAQKRRILTAFKRTVAEFNSEFKDHSLSMY